MGNIYKSKKKTGETSSEYRDRVAKEGAEWYAAGAGQRSHLVVPDSEKVQNNKPAESSTSFQDWYMSKQTTSPSSNNYNGPLAKISSACKAAAKRKFKVWPSAYASGWGVRCTKAGGPSKFGGKK
jgi:hypothetical protein